MVDLLGPGASGASPVLTTTSDVTAPFAGDTWYNDCPAGVADASATPILSKWLNWMMQQDRQAIRFSNVPKANSYDNMLSWAIQSGYANWTGTFGGTTNALTATAPNAPIAVQGGTIVCGIVGTPTNTGAMTLNWAGLGAASLLRNTGEVCTGGEVVNGAFLVVRWDGSAWRICSPMPEARVTELIQEQNLFTSTGVGAILIGGNYVSAVANGVIGTHIGTTGSWYALVGVSATWPHDTSSPGYFNVRDSRWPDGVIPGTWKLISTGKVGPNDPGADYTHACTFLRVS